MNEYVREYTKIETRARRRGSFLFTYAPWLLLLAAAAIFGRVWNQTQAVRLLEELSLLNAEERELMLVKDEHQRALTALTTRERIAQVAREDLGMSYPSEQEVVFLPVPAAPDRSHAVTPRRLEQPQAGFEAFLKNRLRGIVNQEAYALSTL